MNPINRVVIAEDEIAGFSVFDFAFTAKQSCQLALTVDYKKLFRIVQIDGLEVGKNSWFFDNCVVSDGRMFVLFPILKGWMFLKLLSESRAARSGIFLQIEDLLSALQDGSEQPEQAERSRLLQAIYESNQDEVDAFLSKFLPSQSNPEGVCGFRFDVIVFAENVAAFLKQLAVDENLHVPDESILLKTKWSSTNPAMHRLAFFSDNFQQFIPEELFEEICLALNLKHLTDAEITKRLKSSAPLTVDVIKSNSTLHNSDICPTSDYSKLSSAANPGKSCKLASKAKGIASIANFFKKQ